MGKSKRVSKSDFLFAEPRAALPEASGRRGAQRTPERSLRGCAHLEARYHREPPEGRQRVHLNIEGDHHGRRRRRHRQAIDILRVAAKGRPDEARLAAYVEVHAEVRGGDLGDVLAIAVVVSLAIYGVRRPHAVDLDPVGLGRRFLGLRFLGLPGELICEWGGAVE